jgi:hypothetical protein
VISTGAETPESLVGPSWRLRRLHFPTTPATAPDAFIKNHNENAEPFVWTKSKVHHRRVKGCRLSDL